MDDPIKEMGHVHYGRVRLYYRPIIPAAVDTLLKPKWLRASVRVAPCALDEGRSLVHPTCYILLATCYAWLPCMIVCQQGIPDQGGR